MGSEKINIGIKGRRPDLNPRPLAVYDTVIVFITVERERAEATCPVTGPSPESLT